MKIKEIFRKLFGASPENGSLRETIEELIEEDDESESELRSQEKKLLANVIRMAEMTVDDVMMPRADIIGASIDSSYKDLLQLYSKTGFSRLPIYGDTLDDVIGCINVRDLLTLAPDFADTDLKPLIREVLFVPASMRLIDLFLQMRASRIHMAIVVDEYGGVDGLVTAWDVLQELLGDDDTAESYEAKQNIAKLSDGSSIISARMELEDFEVTFGPILTDKEREDEEYDTVGGLITALVGRVPGRKEVIKHPSGFEFEILEADPRRVIRVRVYDKHYSKRAENDAE